MIYVRINRYLFIDVFFINWLDFCSSWYLKKKYKGSEVGVEYFGFNINGLDFLILLNSGMISCGLMRLVCRSFDVIEYFFRFWIFVFEFELWCWSIFFCVI